MSTYNEMDFLPLKINWCRANGLDLYVCDNMSTDGTWEILKKENIPSHRYDTNNVFSEDRMQLEIKNTLMRLNPDYVVYMGCDLFFAVDGRIGDLKNDVTRLPFYLAKYTGEPRTTIGYYYCQPYGTLDFIFKWSPLVHFRADKITFPSDYKIRTPEGLIINYGDTKTPEQRRETLERKKRAWALGENSGYGIHLEWGQQKNWLWDKESLTDMSDNKYLKKIRHDCE